MASLEALVASLRRLLEGEDAPKNEREKKIWATVLDLCQEMSVRLTDLGEVQEDLSLYVQMIDEDLSGLEGCIYGREEEDEEDEALLLELTCPQCGHEIRAPRGPA
ncbi:MAG: CD1247 N-terminal domain-containing protein [Bacteroidota bacterium]